MATDDVAIKELTREVQALSRALGEMQGKAKGAADATKALGDKAEAAGEDSRKATWSIDLGWRQVATGGLAAATAAMGAWVAQIPEGAARAEAHQRALTQLGGAYDAVRTATNGAVSAEQAAAVQQRAAQSGLRLTAQELAAVTQRARDYARATGTELGQALDQLTDQLIDPGEELRKFGVFLRTGMSAGDALRETLRQLGAQAGSTAPAVQSLAEAQEQFHRAAQEASDALSASVAQKLELREFYASLTEWLTTTTGRASALATVYGALVDRLREAVGLEATHARGDNALNQSRSGAWMEQAGPLAAAARRAGVDLGGVDLGALATRGTDAQRAAALDALRRAAGIQVRPAVRVGAGVSRNREFDVDVEGDAETRNAQIRAEADRARRTVAADLSRIAREAQEEFATREASRTLQAEIDAWVAQEERKRELRRRNHASTSAGTGATHTMPGIGGVGGAMLDRLIDEARAEERGSGRLEAALAAARAQTEATQHERDAQRGFTFAHVGGTLGERTDALGLARQSAEVGARRDAGGRIDSGDRVRILTEQRDALKALTDEAVRAEQLARDTHRGQAEINDVMRQRIGIQQALIQTTQELTEATREQSSWMEPWTDAMESAGEGLAQGFGSAIMDVIEGTKSFEQAMGEMLRSSVKAVAQQAIVETIKNTAMAFGHLASGNIPGSLASFKSAGLWAATAVVAGGIVGATRPTAPAVSGDGGSARAASSGASPARPDRERGGGPLVLNISVSGAAFTDAGVHQAVAGALRGAAASGYLTPTDLRGLLDG